MQRGRIKVCKLEKENELRGRCQANETGWKWDGRDGWDGWTGWIG